MCWSDFLFQLETMGGGASLKLLMGPVADGFCPLEYIPLDSIFKVFGLNIFRLNFIIPAVPT